MPGGGLDFDAMHQHAAVAGDDHTRQLGAGAFGADGRGDGPAHRRHGRGGEVAVGRMGLPVVAAKDPVRAGIDQHHAVARRHLSQIGDDARRVDRHGVTRGVSDVVQLVEPLQLRHPGVARCSAGRQRGARSLVALQPANKLARVAGHAGRNIIVAAKGGWVDVDLNRIDRQVRAPEHRVALIQAGAQDQQHIGLQLGRCGRVRAGVVLGRQRQGRVARAAVAEDAQRQRMVLRKHALGAQRGGHRDAEGLSQFDQVIGGDGAHAAVAGQDGDARARSQQGAHAHGGVAVQQARRLCHAITERPIGLRDGLGLQLLRQAQKHRARSVAQHRAQCPMQVVGQERGGAHLEGIGCDRAHQRNVVQAGAAAVLERAAALPVGLHLTGDGQDR